MDTKKAAAAAVLFVALVAGVGYAYITGVGPLEEDPTAGLEEPPETENTYSFGEVSETGGGDGDVNSRTRGATDGGDDTVDDDEGEKDGGTGAEESETQTDGSDGGDDMGDDTEEKEGEEETDVVSNDESRQDDDTGGGDSGDGNDGIDRTRGDSGDDYVEKAGDDTGSRTDTAIQTNVERAGQPFVPELENVEECGETCREATVALQNDMNVVAEDIVVYVRLYAGDSTNPDDVVWGENRELGTLGAGEVYRTTETIDLTPQQANKVRETDGLVTAKATVASDQATATFVEKDDVE